MKDRLGHDFRYAIDSSKIMKKIGWKPSQDFESSLKSTITWYVENNDWCKELMQRKISQKCV